MLAITSLSFASFSFTIYNNNQVASCTYTITAMTVSDNSSPVPCVTMWGGRGWKQVLNPGSTYTFTANCSGSPVWSTISVTVIGSCNTYYFGNSNNNSAGMCWNCNNSDYFTCWQVNGSGGSYEIRPDILVGGRLTSENTKNKKDNVVSEIERTTHFASKNNADENANKIVSSLENTPNPTADFVNLNYELTNDADISVSIFDISGKEVLTMKQGIQKEGQHSLKLDVSSLASGMYSYSFKAGESILTRKFIIAK